MSDIRPLRIDDLPAAAALGRFFYEEGALPGVLVPEVFIATWTHMLSSGNGVIFGKFAGDELVGFLGGVIYNDPNDGELVASEFFWFIRKEYRGGGIALLDAFEEWAKGMGAKRIVMVHLTNLMPESLGAFYRRRGYSPIEVHYMMEV